MNRAGILRATAACARSPVLWPLFRPFYRRRANIVYYHGVWHNGSGARPLLGGISLDAFADDMRTIRRYFQPAALDEVLRFNAAREAVGKPLMAVTFDDGCDLTRSGATAVLDELGIPATTFVVLACVGNRHLMWQHKFSAIRAMRGDGVFLQEFNRLAEKVAPGSSIRSPQEQTSRTRKWPMSRKDEYTDAIWRACDMPPVQEVLEEHRPYVEWADLEDWRRRGHTVGLHTRTHPFSSRLTGAEITTELLEPARELGDRLGLPSVPFAYPFGDRLSRNNEDNVAGTGCISCLLGIKGLSPRGTDPSRLDRVNSESGVNDSVFARPLLRAAKGR